MLENTLCHLFLPSALPLPAGQRHIGRIRQWYKTNCRERESLPWRGGLLMIAAHKQWMSSEEVDHFPEVGAVVLLLCEPFPHDCNFTYLEHRMSTEWAFSIFVSGHLVKALSMFQEYTLYHKSWIAVFSAIPLLYFKLGFLDMSFIYFHLVATK